MSRLNALHQRAMIAEYMGYRWGVFCKMMRANEKPRAVLLPPNFDFADPLAYYRPLQKGDYRDYSSARGVPDYQNDLDALYIVEERLSQDGLKAPYLRHLLRATAEKHGLVTVVSMYNLTHASAAQKCEAICFALGQRKDTLAKTATVTGGVS